MIVIQNLIDAISLGSVYALAALGIGLIFSIMRLINFAHGELIMVGGFVIYALAGNPMFAGGLTRIGEAANRVLSGEAGRVLGHATSGPALQHNLVCVMEALT